MPFACAVVYTAGRLEYNSCKYSAKRERGETKIMNQKFLEIGQQCTPPLFQREVRPIGQIGPVSDASAWQGWRTEPVAGEIPTRFHSGDRMTLDFGRHLAGFLSFRLAHHDRPLDSPVRLRFRFAETPYELAADYGSYHGSLSAAWLQEETVTVDYDSAVSLPRRYAFRYVRMEVISAPAEYGVCLTDWKATAVSSADEGKLKPLKGVSATLAEIDRIGAATLRDCMQTVYEDGPRRDRRLWLGDLRLQALTDTVLFSNTALARRCLYLFAACARGDGVVPSCLYERPEVMADNIYLTDYALIFCAALDEYFGATQDHRTAADLFATAHNQIRYGLSLVGSDGIVTPQEGWWAFIDWCDGLEVVTCVQGVLIYALDKMAHLAEGMGREQAHVYRAEAERLRAAARERLFDPTRRAFVNAYDNYQYSVAAQVWMILARVCEGEEAARLLRECLADGGAKRPVTPYLHHYILEAMAGLGLWRDLEVHLAAYWGSMAAHGADTFWEVYRPEEPMLSPYGDALINSACHAWSCTPSYFIRRYLQESGKN